MKKRLTEQGIKRLRHPEEGQIDIFDEVLPGFGVRVGKRTKSWFVMYRSPEKENENGQKVVRRMSLGRVGVLSLADARAAARDAIGHVQARQDPVVEEKRQQAEEARKKRAAERAEQFTIAATCQRFIDTYAKKLKSARDVEAVFRLHVVPVIGDMQVDKVERRDVVRVLDRLVARGKERTAVKALAHLRKMFNWLMGRGEIENNPAAGIPSPAPIRHRDRVLNDDELVAVWNAAGEMGHPFGPFYRMLILTGARRSEVGGMTWSELDLDAREWTIPAERSKNGIAHIVPLPDTAVEQLTRLPRFSGGDFVFGRDSKNPLSGFGKAKVRLDRLSGVEDWRVHDLRRTFATAHQRIGTRLEVTEALLNHTSGSRAGIVGVYQRHTWAEEKRAAMDAYDRWLKDLIDERPTGSNVFMLAAVKGQKN